MKEEDDEDAKGNCCCCCGRRRLLLFCTCTSPNPSSVSCSNWSVVFVKVNVGGANCSADGVVVVVVVVLLLLLCCCNNTTFCLFRRAPFFFFLFLVLLLLVEECNCRSRTFASSLRKSICSSLLSSFVSTTCNCAKALTNFLSAFFCALFFLTNVLRFCLPFFCCCEEEEDGLCCLRAMVVVVVVLLRLCLPSFGGRCTFERSLPFQEMGLKSWSTAMRAQQNQTSAVEKETKNRGDLFPSSYIHQMKPS